MKHDDNLLVIDTGTSSMRGILTDAQGRMLHTVQFSNFMNIEEDGIAEQDSSSFRSCLTRICTHMSEECHRRNLTLSAVCFTSQRSSVLPLDGEGQPLGKVCMWYDKRALDCCHQLDTDSLKTIHRISGLRATPVLSAPKMLWLKQNQEEIYRSSFKLVGIHDYLLYLCTGRFVTDLSLASRTCLLDIRKQAFSDELLDLFGLDASKLCDLILPGETAGYVTAKFSGQTGLPMGLPVISSGGDQQCSLLGQSVISPGDIGITAGTGAYVAALSDAPLLDGRMRIQTTLSVLPGKFILETNSMAAGSVYQWMADTFYPEATGFDEINRQILQSPPGAGGLIMLPDLAGKGCPEWNFSARGSFHHIGFQHKRPDFSRAALEGICAEIKECVDAIGEVIPPGKSVTSAGGLSNFTEYNQILADMLARPVCGSPIRETTSVGAWAVAAAGLSMYADAAEAINCHTQSLYSSEPVNRFVPDRDRTALYKKQEADRADIRSASSTYH